MSFFNLIEIDFFKSYMLKRDFLFNLNRCLLKSLKYVCISSIWLYRTIFILEIHYFYGGKHYKSSKFQSKAKQ